MLAIATTRHLIPWEVGNPKPKCIPFEEIVYIEADGPELIFIKKEFPNLSYPNSSSQTMVIWNGEFAKLVIGKLFA